MKYIFAIALLAGAAGLALRAQNSAAPAPAPKPPAAPPSEVAKSDDLGVIRVDTRLVVLHVTVVGKDGHLVTNLPQSAFTVYEDGKPQAIKIFRREDIPVSMGLIVDNSGSMRDKRERVKQAALALVQDSNKEDEVFVVNFNDEAFLDLPNGKDFTSNVSEMEQALSKLDSRGGTAMRDALEMSITHEKEKAKKDKKVLVVVTDGEDNSSVITMERLQRSATQSEVIIYTIGLLSEEEKRSASRAKRALSILADTTGGQSFFPRQLSEVEAIAHQVARDIRNQYTIAYSPSNQALDGSFRPIRVTVNAPGKPSVRTRSGYYATKDAK